MEGFISKPCHLTLPVVGHQILHVCHLALDHDPGQRSLEGAFVGQHLSLRIAIRLQALTRGSRWMTGF